MKIHREIHVLLAPLAILILTLATTPETATAQREKLFPEPPGLEPAVEFWKSVYSEWSENEIAFHDREDLSIVYRVMRQEKAETPEQARENRKTQEAVVDRYRRILLDLAARNPDPRTLTEEYEEVYELFGDKGSPALWRQAADRIRVQRGLKERFLQGILHAGQYRDHILAVLEEEGVPEEIAWLPMVESTFNLQARSAVGAAGVWQFMPATARDYLRVDRTVDERFDPILAARGAARLLKRNHQGLGSWPLALTAYNHGYYGMRRAVRELGTNDYMTIRRNYRGPAFGFASKNFYAEFLAALDVASNAVQFFGVYRPLRKLEFDEVDVPIAMRLDDVANAIQVDATRLWKLNPALTERVWRGQQSVPVGFRLRVPPGYARDAPVQLATAVAGRSGRRTQPLGPEGDRSRFYTVQAGDTLLSIAARHGVTVQRLVALNDIRNRDHIRIGQRLKIRR